MPCPFGAVTSSVMPLPVTVLISVIQNREFDWTVLGEIEMVKVEGQGSTSTFEPEIEMETTEQSGSSVGPFTHERTKYLRRMSRWAAFWAAFTISDHILLWPIPMFGARMVFSKNFFIAWVVIWLVWLWFILVVTIFYPLIDGGLQQMWAATTRKRNIGKGEVRSDGGENLSPEESASAEEVGVMGKA
ncbi:uncharacterized protein BDV14DRAFT_197494 [Aspergillus stella-maris]|uniref:uncharacterized protein n=1 Tax=Aspergillus stella-maris TaxID=1810926 RepID=UPI003CCCD040